MGMVREGSAPTVWALLRRGPLVLWGLLIAWVAIAAYELLFWLTDYVEGGPQRVTWFGWVLTPLEIGVAATLLLAIGTAALAYAAVRQARSAESLLDSAEGQANATKRMAESAEAQRAALQSQRAVLEAQLESARENVQTQKQLAAAMTALAQTEEAIRRTNTFPELKVVTVTAGPTGAPSIVVPGAPCTLGLTPTIGIQNFGNGAASKVRIRASWKLLDYGKYPSPSLDEIQNAQWMKVPRVVRGIERLEPRGATMLPTFVWLSMSASEGHKSKRIVGLCLKARWLDPDEEWVTGLQGGILLLQGTLTVDLDNQIATNDYIGLGMQDIGDIPDDAFSDEDPIQV